MISNGNDYQTPKPIQDYFDFLNAPDYKKSPFVTKDRMRTSKNTARL